MRRWNAIGVLPAGLVACILPNPAYDLAGTSGTAGATTTLPTTGAASSGEASGSSDATSTSTGGVSATSTSTSRASDRTTSTGDPTTGGPVDCWGDPSPWEVAALSLNDLADGPHSFRIAPDGLSMVYMGGLKPNRYPRRATRAGLGQPFDFAEQLAAWPGLGGTLDHALPIGDTELFLAGGVDIADGAEIWVSRWQNAAWAVPVAVGPMVNLAMKTDRVPSLSEDGRVLIFERNGGPMNPYFADAALRLYETTRPLGGDPQLDFAVPTPVAVPGITDAAYAHLMSCPTIAPDGLHLFFNSTYPIELTPATIIGAASIYGVERAAVGSEWGSLTHYDELQAPDLHACPHSITRDGCTMIFSRFWFSKEMPMGPPDSFWIATRTPG